MKKMHNAAVETGRLNLSQTICAIRVEIHISPLLLAKGPELLRCRVIFLRTHPLTVGKLRFTEDTRKALARHNQPLKLTLS